MRTDPRPRRLEPFAQRPRAMLNMTSNMTSCSDAQQGARRLSTIRPTIALVRKRDSTYGELQDSYRRQDGTFSAWSDCQTGGAVGRKNRQAPRDPSHGSASQPEGPFRAGSCPYRQEVGVQQDRGWTPRQLGPIHSRAGTAGVPRDTADGLWGAVRAGRSGALSFSCFPPCTRTAFGGFRWPYSACTGQSGVCGRSRRATTGRDDPGAGRPGQGTRTRRIAGPAKFEPAHSRALCAGPAVSR